MSTFFVTGTDTEVGKTAISCALLRAAADAGLRTAAVKPVAAGCDVQGRNGDALLLQESMTLDLPYEAVNPVALQAAVAPHIAAGHENTSLRAGELAMHCEAVMQREVDLVLVEGAGGWRVPLNDTETLADLAVTLNIPVIMVVAMRLGCINHALLTAEAIRGDGLELAGWVANQPGPPMAEYAGNLQTLQSRLAAPLLGEVPALRPFLPEVAARYLDISILTEP